MIAKTTSKQTPFKNVVLIGFTVLLFFGMSLLLVGCGNNSEEQRIAELEAEVERLQNEQILMTLQLLAMQQMMQQSRSSFSESNDLR